MFRFFISSLFLLCHIQSAFGQQLFGNNGLVDIPTADMLKEGTFVGGATFLPPNYLNTTYSYNTGIYYISLTPLKWVELTFRETLKRCKRIYEDELGNACYGEKGYFQQDRSYTVRVAPLFWVKTKWCPQLVLGINDPWSDNGGSYYKSAYGVLTKHFDINKVGDFGLSAGYYKASGDKFGSSNSKSFDGFFCGLGYTPSFWDKMTLSVDYTQKGICAGANVLLFNHWNIFAYERDFKKVGFGMSYQYTMDF